MTTATAKKTKDYYRDEYGVQVALAPQNYVLYGYMKGLGIRSVFEFGCNAGRHLNQLQRMGMEVDGMDINERALEAAKVQHNLTLRTGDETALKDIPSDAYDAVLTVSVLNHMVDIKETLVQLRRIARKHLVFVETRTRTDADRYWWKHDYPGKGVYGYRAKQVKAFYQIWHDTKS